MATIQKLFDFYNLYIKNNPNKIKNVRNIWKIISINQRIILKNIIILDLIKDIINKETDINNKIKIFENVKSREIYPKLLFNIIFKEIYNKQIRYLVNKELFLKKPIEEQEKIKNKVRLNIRQKIKSMTCEEKRKIKNINKYGIEGYKLKLRNQYNKWYNNLSSEKKDKLSIKRQKRYKLLPKERKEEYK